MANTLAHYFLLEFGEISAKGASYACYNDPLVYVNCIWRDGSIVARLHVTFLTDRNHAGDGYCACMANTDKPSR